MSLGCEVIQFVGLDRSDPVTESRTAEIPDVQMEAVGEGSDRRGLEPFATPDESMHLIAFREEQFGEVGAILAGDSSDEGEF